MQESIEGLFKKLVRLGLGVLFNLWILDDIGKIRS